MHPASVGFQCPDCVAKGRKDTRSGRTAYGGLRPTNAAITSLVLIGVNAAIWLATTITGGYQSVLYELLALRSGDLCVEGRGYYPDIPSADLCARFTSGEWVPGVSDGAYWQLVTSAFMHVDALHLLFNCFFLYMVGPQVELVFGRLRFLAVYVVSFLAGSTLVYWAGGIGDSTVGASGGAFGLMGALLVVLLKRRLDVQQLLILIAANFVLTFVVASISWQGHVGGFLGGAAASAALVLTPRGPHRGRVQAAALAGLLVLLVVAIVARSAVLA